jgi:uncharacterized membrane protein
MGVHAKTRLLTLVVILSSTLGNFFLAWGMRRVSAVGLSPVGYISAIFTPWVALGISLLILWLLSRMALLSWADLSYVLPVTSLGYVASAIMGRIFLAESISAERWAGTLLIVLGTALVASTRPSTTGNAL